MGLNIERNLEIKVEDYASHSKLEAAIYQKKQDMKNL